MPFERRVFAKEFSRGVPQNLLIESHRVEREACAMLAEANISIVTETVDRSLSIGVIGAESFYAASRTYWPDLPDRALQPGYAGIRPKIARPGGSTTDFLTQTEKDHGVAGLINLFGIESPGLTASLAIADRVMRNVRV